MSFNLTPPQALLLFGLLARHGESFQADLLPSVKKADRDVLVREKLIEVTKAGRGYQIRLSDSGWAWAGANLKAELPPAYRTLHDLLGRLGDYLAKTGMILPDIIGAAPDATPADRTLARKPKPRRPRTKEPSEARKTKQPVPKPPTPAALRRRIEAAYLVLTGGRKDESVRLVQIRHALGDLDRATLDDALGRILKGDRKASLMRHDDPRQIDRADHDAAFSPAGEPFHLLWIAS